MRRRSFGRGIGGESAQIQQNWLGNPRGSTHNHQPCLLPAVVRKSSTTTTYTPTAQPQREVWVYLFNGVSAVFHQ